MSISRIFFLAALFLSIGLGVESAHARGLSLDMGSGGSATARMIQMILLITVLSLAPSLLVMVTSFTRVIIVCHSCVPPIIAQTTPPNQVLVALALLAYAVHHDAYIPEIV